MAALRESLLSKVIGWSRRSVERNGGVQWPMNMLPYLEREFHLLPRDMAALQCVGRQGSLGRLPVHFVRLYNWTTAYDKGIIIRAYRDLDRCPELILYEGHILKGGTVHLRRKSICVN